MEICRRLGGNKIMEDKIIKTKNGVNLKILTKDMCCIYGDKNSSNYFLQRKDLEELLKKEWN